MNTTVILAARFGQFVPAPRTRPGRCAGPGCLVGTRLAARNGKIAEEGGRPSAQSSSFPPRPAGAKQMSSIPAA